MPYILAELFLPSGDKELIAAPATWLQRQANGPCYVYCPNVKNITKLKLLFEDEYSTPSEIWQRYECDILCRNIPTLALADKMIETMEMESDQANASIHTTVDTPVTQPNIRVRQELQNVRPQSDTNQRSEDNVQRLLSCINKQLADSDPLGDVKPCPQLLDLMSELKCMIQTNQEEIRKKLKEGFGIVEQSLIAHQVETKAIQLAQDGTESDIMANIPGFDRKERFKVDPIRDIEELEQFDERLNDAEFLKKVCGWIDQSLGLVRDSEHRMHIFLDMIMDRKLFASFSWTGGGRDKRALNVLNNVLGLFEYAGTTPMQRVDQYRVEHFIRKKLHNSATRAKAKGVRKSAPRKGVQRKRMIPAKFVLVNTKSQKLSSGTRERTLPRQGEQRSQKSSSSTSTSSFSVQIADANNLSGADCIVIKEDPAAYIEVLDDYESMLD